MAWLEEHPTSGHFKVCFRLGNRRLKKTVKTTDRREAEGVLARMEENLRLLERGRIEMPLGADLGSFLLSDGKLASNPLLVAARPLLLKDLCEMYLKVQSSGAIEANSLRTIRGHLKHIKRTLGESYHVASLGVVELQGHIERRSREGCRGRPISAVTLRKEIASFRACWNWGIHAGKLTNAFPNKGLKYPKTDERPPFQTRADIERQIARGGLSERQIRELWHSLFLDRPEIDELLAHVRSMQIESYLYPMVCLAAHTGARRSELIRLRIDDVDFATGTLVIHEKKRARGRRTTRRIPLSEFVQDMLREWLKVHPGGPHLFCRANREAESLIGNRADDDFKDAFAGTKWQVLRGWHIFRHSFASLLAAAGVDQRLISEWMGHQTEEMVLRYRHLFPDQQRKAINLVFG
jgi:integrase